MPEAAAASRRVSRRAFLKLGCGALAGGAATCLLGPAYVARVEPNWIEVTKVDILLPGLPTDLEGFPIAQLSDFHLGRYVSVQTVRQSTAMANRLNPGLVVLTGDFVYGSASYSAACAQELGSLQARHGVYAVLGNHDVWTDADQVAANLSRVRIVVLRNDRQTIDVGDSRVSLLGIEDTGYTAGFTGGFWGDFQAMWQERSDALATLLEGIPTDEVRLLLVHNPDFAEMLPQGRIDLALCGHTHGGQVRLPLIGAPAVPSCFGQRYAGGPVQAAGTVVYVNRGIGLIAPPVRFNCRPELTLLRLRRK